MLWQLRAPTEDDVNFIFNSWLKSHRQSTLNADIGNQVYFKNMHDNIEAVIRSPNSHIVVACSPQKGDDNVIFGYCVGETVGEELVIHLVYVKHPFRSFGMGRDLESQLLKIPHTTVAFSCMTKLAKTLNRKRQYNFNPWLLWSKK